FRAMDQHECVGANTTVTVAAQANLHHVLSNQYSSTWRHTDDDHGTGNTDRDDGAVCGNPPVSTAKVTVHDNGTACVWVCCPGEPNFIPNDCTFEADPCL